MVLLNLHTKTGFLGLLSRFSFLVITCFWSCGMHVKCEDTKYYYCVPNSIDTLLLDTIIDSNFPSTFHVLSFKNSNGFVTQFFPITPNLRTSFLTSNLLAKTVIGECGSDMCYDYISIENKFLRYSSLNVPFNFTYRLYGVSTTLAQQYIIDSIVRGYSQASIMMDNDEFKIVDKNPKNTVLLDSIVINNKLYLSVYQIYLDSSKRNETRIKPEGVFYKTGVGLLGFYLTNGELWGVE